jgi:zinc protease
MALSKIKLKKLTACFNSKYLRASMVLALLLILILSLGLRMMTPIPYRSTKAEMPQFIREFSGIKEYRLANGLQILLFPDQLQTTTTVHINYRVGARHEAPGEYGIAHVLEHMQFSGTRKHPHILEATRQRAMEIDATTFPDRTYYQSRFKAQPATLKFALALEADRMLNTLFTQARLDKEMTVVRNEFELSENQPARLLSKRVSATAYQWHNYGHDVLGVSSDIEKLSIARLQAFYQRFYRPDNATLIVSGRFDPKATLRQIATLYGPLQAPSQTIPQPGTVEPAQDGERRVVVRRVGGKPMLMAYYHIPAVTHPDIPALMLLAHMLEAEPGGPLYTQLVQPKLALATGLSLMHGVDAGGIAAMAQLAPDSDLAQAEHKLLAVLEGHARPAHAGPALNEAALERMRTAAMQAYRDELKSPELLVKRLLGCGTEWRTYFLIMQEISKVTLADVQRVRNTYLRPVNRTMGVLLPANHVQQVEIPAAPPLDPRLDQLTEPQQVEQGELLEPLPEQLARRTLSKRLPSGIVLTTLNKRSPGEAVQLGIRLRWGDQHTLYPQRRGSGVIADLMAEGSQTMSREQLQQRLLQLKADIIFYSDLQAATLFIKAEKDTLLQVLEIAADILRYPRLPADAFDRAQQRGIAETTGARQSLEVLSQMALREHYNRARKAGRDDPGYLPSVKELVAEIQATTLADAKRFYHDHWSADQAEVVAVGNVPAGLDSAVEKLLGDWKKPQLSPYVASAPPAVTVAPARFDVQANGKSVASLFMQQSLALSDRDPDYLALAAAAHIFGTGMESRLAMRVRHQAGISYVIDGTLQVPHFGNAADLCITASFAPDQRLQILALIADELQRMGNDGISETELARFKRDLLENVFAQERSDDTALVNELLRQREYGQDWHWAASRDQAIAALTVAQVNAAWRKYIKPGGFVIVTAGDFKRTSLPVKGLRLNMS